MASQPPINTYHCICTTLLLSTTHTLSSLPRRSTTSSSGLDAAIILPLPSSPPSPPSPPSPSLQPSATTSDLPPEGYTILLGLTHETKPTIIRREDGFEKRSLYRCSRCRVVVGYEIADAMGGEGGEEMDIDSGKGKEVEGQGQGQGEYKGKVIYLLNGGLMSTDVMVKGRKIREEDVQIGGVGGVGVFE